MIGATVDITEDKLREQELAAARAEIEATRENMRLVLENMHDGILLLDKDGRWRFAVCAVQPVRPDAARGREARSLPSSASTCCRASSAHSMPRIISGGVRKAEDALL